LHGQTFAKEREREREQFKKEYKSNYFSSKDAIMKNQNAQENSDDALFLSVDKCCLKCLEANT
jgi:hypothetical protein